MSHLCHITSRTKLLEGGYWDCEVDYGNGIHIHAVLHKSRVAEIDLKQRLYTLLRGTCTDGDVTDVFNQLDDLLDLQYSHGADNAQDEC
jgi:hypothetical protein